MPYYSFDEFKSACSGKDAALRVFINFNSERDASKDFKLRMKSDIRRFIANGGLEDLAFQNTATLEKNPYSHDIYIDAYVFRSGNIYGYLAFYRLDKPGKSKWMIKSFKKSDSIPNGIADNYLKSSEIMRNAIQKYRGGSYGK